LKICASKTRTAKILEQPHRNCQSVSPGVTAKAGKARPSIIPIASQKKVQNSKEPAIAQIIKLLDLHSTNSIFYFWAFEVSALAVFGLGLLVAEGLASLITAPDRS
jgi:hypothetical protein